MGIGTFINQSVRPAATPARRVRAPSGDLVLVAVVIALGIFGLLMLGSASPDFSQQTYGSATYIIIKQLAFMASGTLIAFGISRIDYHLWRKFAVPLMCVTVILLIAVLISNDVRNNAVRTFFGGSVQPSELAKLATIIYLSIWLYSKREHLHDIQLGLMPLAFILGAIGGLIVLQPDLSAAITIFILGGLLFFLAGGDMRQIILFCIVALAAGWLVVQFSSTGKARIGSYIAGLKDPLKSSSHVLWSLEAIYKGGWFGVGIGQATTKLIGLPFAATDSIFAVVVEELGLFGALGLTGLYAVLAWRGLKIAGQAPDSLGSVMAAGLTFWIVIEAAINMAVMVGLLPFAGNALPFVSAGGSNLLSTLAAIGILLNISRQSGQTAPSRAGTGTTPESKERKMYSASVDLRRWNRRRSVSRTRRPANHAK
ncbi:MAG: putative peptidoglycan glycosyltransferase FtsW [Chloroflexi bacterium]|nr:putative peptidoglycan glycosyltransferase FtsW [Chloroflexota bacterium]